MKRSGSVLMFLFLCLAVTVPSFGETPVTILHSFNNDWKDGAQPYGDLVRWGDTFYGMTLYGGASNVGTIFSINADGSNMKILHTFVRSIQDGSFPFGSLTLSRDGSTLYGLANGGGDSNSGQGIVFSLATDGSRFTILHSFSRSDGYFPYGSLTLSIDGATLYGMTNVGGGPACGGDGCGSIFSIGVDGKGFKVLHSFVRGTDDGAQPWYGSLTLSHDGSTLYGMTCYGGGGAGCPVLGCGTIFSINTDGTGYGLLHRFAGGGDGAAPYGSLILSDDGKTLYGMTALGGGTGCKGAGCGTVFSIGTKGTGYRSLYSFAGGASDGATPYGSLTLSDDGTTLYGMNGFSGGGWCRSGDVNIGCGTVFSLNTDGSGHTVLHSFAGGTTDGGWPLGSLALFGANVYGMTNIGGGWGCTGPGCGIIFSLRVLPAGMKLLTIRKSGVGTGTVSSSPARINCGNTCSASFTEGTTVTLTATATPGSVFKSWSGCTGSGSICTVAMTADKSATATFIAGNPTKLTVTKVKASGGDGTITSNPPGINCGKVCFASYGQGAIVTLMAAPTGTSVVGWTGCASASGNTCTVTMDRAKVVKATFTGPQALAVTNVSVSKGTGTITSNPPGITCTKSTCRGSFPYKSTVTLTAAAGASSVLAGWTGCASASGNTCTVTMDKAKVVKATFTGPQTLAVTNVSVSKGTGTITSNPQGIACTKGTCRTTFLYNTKVTLTATPNTGSSFNGWAGGCTGSGTCVITMNKAQNVTGRFGKKRGFTEGAAE